MIYVGHNLYIEKKRAFLRDYDRLSPLAQRRVDVASSHIVEDHIKGVPLRKSLRPKLVQKCRKQKIWECYAGPNQRILLSSASSAGTHFLVFYQIIPHDGFYKDLKHLTFKNGGSF